MYVDPVDAGKKAVLRAMRPAKNRFERREVDREIVAALGEYRKVSTDGNDYEADLASLEKIVDEVAALPYDEALENYTRLTSEPAFRPSFYDDPDKGDIQGFMAGSKFADNRESETN